MRAATSISWVMSWPASTRFANSPLHRSQASPQPSTVWKYGRRAGCAALAPGPGARRQCGAVVGRGSTSVDRRRGGGAPPSRRRAGAGAAAAAGGAGAPRHSWRDAGVDARSHLLRTVAGVLRADKTRYAALLTSEMGKPIVEAEGEVEKCAWTAAWIADNAARLLADEPVDSTGSESYVRFQPLGVVLAVMPWNFPFWQAFRAGLPALAAGNVMLLKHSSNVPQSALAIEEVFREAGLPEGVFQTLLIGPGAVEGIIADRRVAGVTLTGSEAAGSLVATAAGKALKKSVLELGGSDPFIVLEDADIATAATVACRARNQNNGQSCIAAKRFIVEEPVADEFEHRLTQAVGALKVGNPMDRGNQVGPLAREDLVEELERQVTDSVRLGARTLTGGKRLDGGGYYF